MFVNDISSIYVSNNIIINVFNLQCHYFYKKESLVFSRSSLLEHNLILYQCPKN